MWVPGTLVFSMLLFYALLAFILLFAPTPELSTDRLALRYFIAFFAVSAVAFVVYGLRFLEPEWIAVSVILTRLIVLLAYYCLHVGFCHRSQTRSVLMRPVVALPAFLLFLVWLTYSYFSGVEHYRYLTLLYMIVLLLFSLRVLQGKQTELHLGDRLTRWSLYTALALLLALGVARGMLEVLDIRYMFVMFIVMMAIGILLLGGMYGSFLNDAVARHYHNSVTDSLTGLYNRRYLIDESRRLLSAAERHHFPLSVVMCDIDKFKNINDTCGHDIGDDVIKVIARVLQRCTRTEDILARWGGEEFVVLLSRTEVEQSKMLAERMREEIGRISLDTESGSLAFTASFGVAVVDVGSGVEAGIKHADDALYRAKASGRNCVEVSKN